MPNAKIVMMSGYAISELGPVDFPNDVALLHKPFGAEVLLQRVHGHIHSGRNFLDRHSAADQDLDLFPIGRGDLDLGPAGAFALSLFGRLGARLRLRSFAAGLTLNHPGIP